MGVVKLVDGVGSQVTDVLVVTTSNLLAVVFVFPSSTAGHIWRLEIMASQQCFTRSTTLSRYPTLICKKELPSKQPLLLEARSCSDLPKQIDPPVSIFPDRSSPFFFACESHTFVSAFYIPNKLL